ncbi:hypothetical protein ES703_93924 [subsurface metagenome]
MKQEESYRPPQGRGLPQHRRLKPSKTQKLQDCLGGILLMKTEGREDEFVPISIYEIQIDFRDKYFINLNYGQVAYLIKKLVEKGFVLRELHNRDRTAKSWKDEVSRYKVNWPS